MPRIQVSAEQHDLVLQHRIRSRQVGNDVVAVRIVGEKARLHVDLELDGNAALHHSRDHVVVLPREHHRRDRVVAKVASKDEYGTVLPGARAHDSTDARVMQ